eukprot:CAMPEP_0172462312 /NCGR_PEP_ID=MMETSP1065-20121228/43492_1 /TAXON_ID=265537 /ORGANISM="Amphiprora paludosa, Strain CCMP125" /LENGTH=41 /DNA_ID= /DNA_START= /DNA_END= /DNA_ORIENTATION=
MAAAACTLVANPPVTSCACDDAPAVHGDEAWVLGISSRPWS